MAKRKAIVFLRQNNDIDHVVPILYKWLSLDDVLIQVVVITDKKLLQDPRIVFLKQFRNAHIKHISDYSSIQDKIKYFCRLSKIKNIIEVGFNHFINYFSSKKIKIKGFNSYPDEYFATDNYVEKIFSDWFALGDNGMIVFDWIGPVRFVQIVLSKAKARNLVTVSLPHGDSPHASKIIALNDLNYNCINAFKCGEMFDYAFVPNKLCARRYTPHLPAERIKILGSPRYNDEWLDIVTRLLPQDNTLPDKAKIKIVFFLCNFNYPVFWEELIRTIKLVIQFPDIYLIVKHHPRSGTVKKLIQAYPELNENVANLKFVYDDVASSDLMQWADVVLDIGTSVSFEAVKRKKPVLAIEYVIAYRTAIAEYIKRCDVKCRDELYDNLVYFLNNGTNGFYNEQERQVFVKDMIDYPDANVLDRYVEALQTCFIN